MSIVSESARTSVLLSMLLVLAGWTCGGAGRHYIYDHGAIVRGDTLSQAIALAFTGDEFADGAEHIAEVLDSLDIRASFFFTGRFYRNSEFEVFVDRLLRDGHYLGAHSDQHLLYCSWENRDSLLVSREEFERDVGDNYLIMQRFGIDRQSARYFLPPYEWYNEEIAGWTNALGLELVNYSPGTRSHADYTTPDLGTRYISSSKIVDSILSFEETQERGLNGFILLSHVGVDPKRTDKFYLLLGSLINTLSERGYAFVRIDEMLAR